MNNEEINNVTVTEDDINKALENLTNNDVVIEGEEITKAVKTDEDETKVGTNAKTEGDDGDDDGDDKKKEVKKGEVEYEYKEMEKAEGCFQKFEKGSDAPVDAKQYSQDANGGYAEIKKAVEKTEEITKAAEEEAFEKALDTNPTLDRFHKSILSMEDAIDEKFSDVAILMKGMLDSNKALSAEIKELKDTPMAGKSVTTNPVDRFAKSEQAEAIANGALSITGNRKAVLDLMEKSAFAGEGDDVLMKGVLAFEQSGNISQPVQNAFELATGKTLVP